MAYIAVAEIVLNQAGIRASFRQLVATGVTQHMGVSMGHGAGVFPGGANDAIRLLTGEGRSAPGDKKRVGFPGRFPARPYLAPVINGFPLIETQRMDGGKTVL